MAFVVWGDRWFAIILSHLAAGLHPTQEGGDGEASIEVEGREDHATTLDAHHFAGSEVGDEEHVLADQLLGLIVLGDTREDGAVRTRSVVDGKLQELVAFLHRVAVLDVTHTDVELLPLAEIDVRLDRCRLVVGSSLLGLVGLLRGSELVELLLDDLVLDLLEEQVRLGQLMARLQQFRAAQILPVETVETEHCAQVLAGERQEGLKGDTEVGNELQRDIEHRLHTVGIRLPHLPRLTLRDVAVADAGEVHCLLLRLTEVESVEELLHLVLHVLKLLHGLAIDIEEVAWCGHHAIPVFLRELQGAIDEVAIDSHQLRVVALLEVLPREVVVLRLGGIGREHIAQHILLAREIDQILMEPDGPVARRGDLVVLQVEKLVGGHVVGQDIASVGLEHGGEDEAVEDDIVLADEVDEARLRVLPPFLPRPQRAGSASQSSLVLEI